MGKASKPHIEITSAPRGDGFRLLVRGGQQILTLLESDIAEYRFPKWFAATVRDFDWYCYCYGVPQTFKTAVERFHNKMKDYIFIEDEMDICMAIDYHTTGEGHRTGIGELVYQSKPYNAIPTMIHHQNSLKLVQHYIRCITHIPPFNDAQYVIATPSSKSDSLYNLPEIIAHEICKQTGKNRSPLTITKIRKCLPMKNCQNLEEKRKNIKGAFRAEGCIDSHASVILIDDIYDSGCTMNEIARTLRTAGASKILGLAATKTRAYN